MSFRLCTLFVFARPRPQRSSSSTKHSTHAERVFALVAQPSRRRWIPAPPTPLHMHHAGHHPVRPARHSGRAEVFSTPSAHKQGSEYDLAGGSQRRTDAVGPHCPPTKSGHGRRHPALSCRHKSRLRKCAAATTTVHLYLATPNLPSTLKNIATEVLGSPRHLSRPHSFPRGHLIETFSPQRSLFGARICRGRHRVQILEYLVPASLPHDTAVRERPAQEFGTPLRYDLKNHAR